MRILKDIVYTRLLLNFEEDTLTGIVISTDALISRLKRSTETIFVLINEVTVELRKSSSFAHVGSPVTIEIFFCKSDSAFGGVG